MEFRIKKEDLFKGLQKAQGIVAAKGAMPILANILLEAREGEIAISATDLDMGMEGQYPAQVAIPGRLTINARKIFDIVRELPDEEISVKSSENDWLNLSCGRSKFKIAGIPPEEFPKLPSFEDSAFSMKLERDVLRDLIRKTIYASSNDTTRRNLNGTLLELEEKEIRMVGTDGHRLAFASYATQEPIAEPGKTHSVILPKKALGEILKFLEDGEGPITFYLGENHASFRKEKFRLVSRLVDDQFPLYRQVIPTENQHKAVADRDSFLHALKRVSIMSDESSRLVRFEFGQGQLRLMAQNADIGEAAEEIEIECSGQDIPIGLNATYILDVLNNMPSEQVDIFLKDTRSSCLISPMGDDSYKCIVMPMRLN